jgi:predicted nucleic acid-binding protein
MVYLDSSVAVAQLVVEDRRPSLDFWDQSLISSRLLEYEVLTKTHLPSTPPLARDAARTLVRRIALVELIPEIVARIHEPLPLVVRTLDALHIATMIFLLEQGVAIELASYDERLKSAATKVKIPLASL